MSITGPAARNVNSSVQVLSNKQLSEWSSCFVSFKKMGFFSECFWLNPLPTGKNDVILYLMTSKKETDP